jgi:hypothetical protein
MEKFLSISSDEKELVTFRCRMESVNWGGINIDHRGGEGQFMMPSNCGHVMS